LSNSKTLIFTPKIWKSIRRHNARHFFETSECAFYHGVWGRALSSCLVGLQTSWSWAYPAVDDGRCDRVVLL
jgi:hypothetical protein